MYTVTSGAVTIELYLVLDYATTRRSRSLIHDVLGSGIPDVTLRPLGSREGTLSLFCLTRAAALALEALHRTGSVLTLTDPEVPPMGYVVDGAVTVTYVAEFDRWRVDVGYREVTA